MRKHLRCKSQDGNPIAGLVEFSYFGSAKSIPRKIGSDGCVEVPISDLGEPHIGIVKPVDGHWNHYVSNDMFEQDCVLRKINFDDALYWHLELLGFDQDKIWGDSEIVIGIVDLAFSPEKSFGLQHVEVYDIEGARLQPESLHSHGERVSRLIGERASRNERSAIAANAKIVFIDVSLASYPFKWDFDKIAPAIELLADKFKANVINVSGGVQEPFADLSTEEFDHLVKYFSEAVDYAKRRGTLIIAAAGNNPEMPIALPAALPEVVGVGAIGQCEVAPPGTVLRVYEDRAAKSLGCTGTSYGGKRVFHYVDTSFGSGLDVVGPGVGILLKTDDKLVAEYEGTSYASPLVTALLGHALSSDRVYHGRPSDQRVDRARELLQEKCEKTGISREREGWGLPNVHS